MAARIFAVLAAAFLVVAIGFASVTPFGLTLGQGLLMLDASTLQWAQSHSGGWLWDWIETPVLLRPLWLLPASAGVVCAGLALSFNFGKASQSRRRRS